MVGKNINSFWTIFAPFSLCYERKISRRAREKDIWHANLPCMFVKKQKHVLKIKQI